MKKLLLTFLLLTLILAPNQKVQAKKSDLYMAKKIAICFHKPIKVVKENKVPLKRKGIVYIEVLQTKSTGKKYGYTSDGYFVKYPKKVAKNKKVKVYLVWNPNNNYCDDVAFVVCLGKVK